MSDDKMLFSNLSPTALIDQKTAAKYLGTTVGSMNTLRHQGKLDIPFVRFNSRIKYRKCDLDAWIAAHSENTVNIDGGQNAHQI